MARQNSEMSKSAATENDDTLIAVLPKNATEEIHVQLRKYNGHHLVDLRINANYGDANGVRVPTKKGVTLRVAQLPELIGALLQAEAKAREAGHLVDRSRAA